MDPSRGRTRTGPQRLTLPPRSDRTRQASKARPCLIIGWVRKQPDHATFCTHPMIKDDPAGGWVVAGPATTRAGLPARHRRRLTVNDVTSVRLLRTPRLL